MEISEDNYKLLMEYEILKSGKESFYEGILRHKSPYSGDYAVWWVEGWDAADAEHKIFAELQELKAERESCKLAVEGHANVVDKKEEEIAALKKDKIHLYIHIDAINGMVSSLYNYIGATKLFFLSREKITSPLKKILEGDFPEAKKT